MTGSKKASKKKAKRAKPARNTATARTVIWTVVGDELCLNQTDAARWFGVSVSMFRRYEIEPSVKRGRDVYYSESTLKDALRRQSYQRGFQEGHAAKPQNAGDIIEAQALAELRLTEERGETQALKNARLRRELAPVEALTLALGSLAGEISAIVDGLPGKIKRRQPKLNKSDIEVIQRECVKAMNACAEAGLDWDEIELAE